RQPIGDCRERLLAVHRHGHLEAFFLEVIAEDFDQRRLVLDDQDVRLDSAAAYRPLSADFRRGHHCVPALAALAGLTIVKLDASPFGRASRSGTALTWK